VPGAIYLHVLYERKAAGLTRFDLALTPEPARTRELPGPRGRFLWRVFALDEKTQPVAATGLLAVGEGALP
jgi:hypothetical protein